MTAVCIISNNPLVAEHFPRLTRLLATDVAGVYRTARDRIHLGAVLLNHPRAGSIRPQQNPYRSLLLALGGAELNLQSLQWIEQALATLWGGEGGCCPPQLDADYRLIDCDLLCSAMGALPPVYHTGADPMQASDINIKQG